MKFGLIGGVFKRVADAVSLLTSTGTTYGTAYDCNATITLEQDYLGDEEWET